PGRTPLWPARPPEAAAASVDRHRRHPRRLDARERRGCWMQGGAVAAPWNRTARAPMRAVVQDRVREAAGSAGDCCDHFVCRRLPTVANPSPRIAAVEGRLAE